MNRKEMPRNNIKLYTVEWLKIVQERCSVKDNLMNITPISISVVKQYVS